MEPFSQVTDGLASSMLPHTHIYHSRKLLSKGDMTHSLTAMSRITLEPLAQEDCCPIKNNLLGTTTPINFI